MVARSEEPEGLAPDTPLRPHYRITGLPALIGSAEPLCGRGMQSHPIEKRRVFWPSVRR